MNQRYKRMQAAIVAALGGISQQFVISVWGYLPGITRIERCLASDQGLGQVLTHGLQPLPLGSADKESWNLHPIELIAVCKRWWPPVWLNGIQFIEYQNLRHVFCPNFPKNLLDLLYLFRVGRVGGIDHMQQQICIDCFL